MKGSLRDSLIIGLALFASYFGAGNLIFPPLLGLQSANQWVIGSAGFILSGVFMPVLALYVISRAGGSVEKLTKDLHPSFSKYLLLLIMLFAGHVSVPRTGAVGYELGVEAVFPNFPMPVFIILYFAIAFYFSLDVNEMIDKVGKYLTPALVIILIFIIIKGVFTPLGTPTEPSVDNVLVNSFLGGYQTGDLIVSYLLGTVFIGDIIRRGYSSDKERNRMTANAGVIAFVLLFVIYVGLLFLGAKVSAVYPPDVDRSELLLAIVNTVLGKTGLYALGIAVILACLTTAIGQITSIAAFFHEFSKGKISHKLAAAVFSIIGASIALLGVEKIVFITTPIFLGVYPSLIVLMILGIFKNYLPNKASYRLTMIFTLVISIIEAANSILGIEAIGKFINMIPLNSYGFAWVLPAVLGFIIGAVIGKKEN
jgi:LIVCS family branched-chain amino acid:cation transporter